MRGLSLMTNFLANDTVRVLIFPLAAILMAIGLRGAAGEGWKDSAMHAWTDVLAVSCLGMLAISGQAAFTLNNDILRLHQKPTLSKGLTAFLELRDAKFPDLILNNMVGLFGFAMLGLVVATTRNRSVAPAARSRRRHFLTGMGWLVCIAAMTLHVLLARTALDLLSGAAVTK